MKPEAGIVVMAKQPRVGLSKTRLCPPFSLEEAAGLSEALLRDTIELAAGIENAALAVAVTPVSALAYFRAVTPPRTILLPVEAAHIGACLAQVLEKLLALGFSKALALNADGPSLPRTHLTQALDLLEQNDVVFGPANDGGYYLVGLKAPQPHLFEDISWSTDLVLAESLDRAAELGLRAAKTPPWYDVDTAAEVRLLAEELRSLPEASLPYSRRFLAQLRPALLLE